MAGPSFPTLSTSTSIDSKPKPIRPLLERRRRWTEPNHNNHVNNLSITTSPTRFKDSTVISNKELEDLTLLFKNQRKGGAESQRDPLVSRPRRRHTTSNQHYNGRERGRTHQRSGSFNGNNLNVVRDQVDQKSKSLDSRIVSPSSNSTSQTSTSKDQTHFQFKPSKPTFSMSLLDEDGNEIDSEGEEEEMMDDYLLTPRASKFNSTFISPSPTSVTPRASTFNLNDKSKTMERSRPSSSSSQGRREETGGSLMGGMEQLREFGRFKDDEEEKRVIGLGPKSDENQDADNEEEEESVEDEFTDFDSVVDVEHDDETVNSSNWIPFDSKISTSSKISSTTNWISKTIEDRTSSLSRTSSCNSIASFHSCFEDDSDSDSDSSSSDSDQEERVEVEEENDEDNEWETLIPTKGSFLSTRTNSSDVQVTKSLDSNITRPKIYRSSKFGSTSSLSSLGEDEKDGRIRARPLEEVKLTLPSIKYGGW